MFRFVQWLPISWFAALVGSFTWLVTASPTLGKEVIEQPEWAVGDWWEFQGSPNNFRLTVMAPEGDQYILVSTLPNASGRHDGGQDGNGCSRRRNS